jgi:FkbM family methyltransferase
MDNGRNRTRGRLEGDRTMIKFEEWMLPDREKHLQEWMTKVNHRANGRIAYQLNKYEMALRHCPLSRRRTAVDIGAHVGLWSWHMSHDFQQLKAFEPYPDHIECYKENMQPRENWNLYFTALGDKDGVVNIRTRTLDSSGDTGIEDEGITVKIHRLDDYNFTNVDFIKVDCEGYEYFALKGATETLKRWKPTVIVEQKGFETKYGLRLAQAVEYLCELGAVVKAQYSGDYVCVWE